ncbi:hypothetical protein SAY86_001702 [Trapa natans]|uniref:C2 domain-containing protein n=1 Tax=Trapa natans TaxID=22666 RepID=A0AAN7R420_TRANT|nr:hypothetical protein SAY86_001702 [Trapa natans]
MVRRLLEIVVISAKELKNMKHITTMDVYVEATISGDTSAKQITPVAKNGGTKPTWNFPMQFTVDTTPEALQRSHPILLLKLRCVRTVRDDKDIGEARVPVEDLFARSGGGTSDWNVSYPVLMPNGKPRGEVNFSFKFGPEMGAQSLFRPHGYPVMAVPYAVSAPPPPPTYEEIPPLGYPSVEEPDDHL